MRKGIRMVALCPFFRDKCRGNDCVMWKDEKCLVVSYMENVIATQREIQMRTQEIQIPETIRTHAYGYVPDEIKSATPEELADELVAFTKKEFPDRKEGWIRDVADLFWKSKNIDWAGNPTEIQFKIEKAEMLAQRAIVKEQIEKEKEKLPSLIDSCVEWAREHGFKRVTHADLGAFLIEKNIELITQTRRTLYAMVNMKLKSKPQ